MCCGERLFLAPGASRSLLRYPTFPCFNPRLFLAPEAVHSGFRGILSIVSHADSEITRRAEDTVVRRMRTTPVVVLHGPRTVGKSTLLRALARRFDRTVGDLDQRSTRDIAEATPSFWVQGDPPVFIDEYQHVPALLDAIKAELNLGITPGRFVITGSTSYTTIPRAAQSLTGRADVLSVWPLSQGELEGHRESFIEQLVTDPQGIGYDTESRTSRMDYVDRVLRGGMPLAVRLGSETDRRRWFAGYLDLVISRDVFDISRIRQRDAMPRLLQRLATQTAQLLNMAQASAHAGLQASVGEQYTLLLEAVFMIHRVRAWGAHGARVGSRPKVHVVDTGVGAWLMGLSRRQIERRSTTAMQQFGHLLESFGVNEILKQVSWLDEPINVGHYRTKDGAEVDLVLEIHGEGVIGVEIKSGERFRAEDLRGLRSLRDRAGPEFLGGVLLHPGAEAVRLEDRIQALPLDVLWR